MAFSVYYTIEQQNKLSSCILLSNEKQFTFDVIFKNFKRKYEFIQTNITCDFRISQIITIKNIFPNSNFYCFLYHFPMLYRLFS